MYMVGLLALGTFCFLLLFSAVGGGRLAVVDEIVEHGDGVLCGGFCTNVVFFDVALCDGIRVLCGLLCAGCGYDVSGIANLAAKAGGFFCTSKVVQLTAMSIGIILGG